MTSVTSGRQAGAVQDGSEVVFRTLTHAVAVVWGLLLVAAVAGQLFDIAPGPSSVLHPFVAVAAITFTLLGGLIVPRRPRNAVGWLFVAMGLSSTLAFVGASFAGIRLMAWLSSWATALTYGLMPIALLVFPDGRLPSRRWRPFVWAVAASMIVAAVFRALAVWSAPRLVFEMDVRLQGSAYIAKVVSKAGLAVALLSLVPAAASLVVRWRRADVETRQQLKALAAGAAVVPAGIMLEILGLPKVEVLAAVAVPVAAAVAILKYRLYDIDLFLNRSLVYTTLTVLIVAAYRGITTLIDERLTAHAGWGPWVATVFVAMVAQPVRDRVQKGANRLLYGSRDDPYAVVSQLSRQLEQGTDVDTMLPQAVQMIAESLQLPYVAVELNTPDGPQLVADHGRRAAEPEAFPMIHQWQVVGRLLASARSPRHPFTDAERNLLGDLARQVGLAVRAEEHLVRRSPAHSVDVSGRSTTKNVQGS